MTKRPGPVPLRLDLADEAVRTGAVPIRGRCLAPAPSGENGSVIDRCSFADRG